MSRPTTDPRSELAGLTREEKVALLKRLARERRPTTAPLSFAQHRMWFLDQLEPGNSFYNVCRALRFTGPLEVAAMARSFAAIVRRHGALRIFFPAAAGEPRQQVAPAEGPALLVVDLERLAPADRDAETAEQVQLEYRRPFDLARGPLYRAGLLRAGAGDHVLLLSVHHIVFDGWSMGILFRELALHYRAFVAGETPALDPLPLQYPDFARWQRKHLTGETLEKLMTYWRRQLEGAPTTLELPTDRPRPAIESYRGAIHTATFPAALSRELGELSRSCGATLFMTLLAALAGLLYRYSAQRDLVVGTPIANRNRPQLEGLIGLFANTLVLRVHIGGNQSFKELLAPLRRDALGAFAHQDLPFERLVEELRPERDLSRNPLFQVMFALQNVPAGDLELPGVEGSFVKIDRDLAKVDLSLDAIEMPEGLFSSFEFNTDLFDRSTIARLATHWRVLLEGIVADPHRPLAELPLLSASERYLLLTGWNDTAGRPADGSIHQLLAARTAAHPDAVAVAAGTTRLSYGELDRRAERLAGRLRRLEVGPDVPVGVLLERGWEALVAMLAVLKAGGAYVPLDPDYPAQRLAFLIDDTRMPVVLCQRRLEHRLPQPSASIAVVPVDGELPEGDHRPTPVPVAPEAAAYLIYTSGSTGRPKGVVVPHRAVVNHATAIVERYRLGPGDRVLQFAALNFDVAAEEIFPTWLAGATLVLRPAELSLVLSDFLDFVECERLTVLNLPTPYWHEWAAEPSAAEPPPALRLLVVGTEQASAERLAAWQRLTAGRIGLVNSYGPTETTITATAWESTPGTATAELPRVPIGRALANVRAHLLDSVLAPVPVGVPGHLHIGGRGLARGYLERPGATAEAFVPDPFADAAGGRLYRTGDLARWRADGHLDFLGRIDDQVKVRGFRIEPGEIEAALGDHPAVRETFVMAREDRPGDRRLVAYLVFDPAGEVSPEALRNHLLGKLPGYMVPAAFVGLEELPLTSSGKIDRRALPAPDGARPLGDGRWAAPRSPLEELVAGIWAEVLGVERVGVHDNFFVLGGHSLVATQITSRLRRALEIEVPLRTLFEAPTVAALCERLAAAETRSSAPPLGARPRDGELPLSFAQQRLWFLDKLEPGSPAYNLAAPVRLLGELDPRSLDGALHAIVRRHESLRTTFRETEDRAVQVIHPPSSPDLPRIDLSALPEEIREATARALGAAEARLPFDLARGPLLRALLVRLGARDHMLQLTMHHIIADGWSVDILLRELMELYRAVRDQRAPRLPELALQYADYAQWQREWLAGELLASQLAYWREQLAGAPAALELPTDHARPAVPSYRGGRCYFSLPAELTAGLHELGRRRGATLFMTLTAVFDLLLHRYSGQPSIVVGTPIAGRNRTEIEGLIGLFLNTLVLRADLDGRPDFHTLLERVREAALGAYVHQDLPFEQLVDELQPTRDMSRNPLFQAFFNLLWVDPPEPGEAPEPEVRTMSLDSGTAQFDLALTLWEAGPELAGFMTYSHDLFDRSTIARATRHFQTLVAGIVGAPERAVGTLPLLAASESQQLVREWNVTVEPLPAANVDQLIAAQAAARPGEVAVAGTGVELTYAELDARSNQLARHLRTLGVGAESLVGVLVERSPAMVIALLGVVKAGGTYVPLDPEYPRERIAYMFEDSAARVVLTQESLVDSLPDGGPRPVCLDRDWPLIDGHSPEAPAPQADPEQLAYVIYTSGSTGRPKGVAIPHRALVNFLISMGQRPGLSPADRLLAVTTLSFDIAGLELYLPLIAGARVELAGRDEVVAGDELIARLRDSAVTVMQATPATWRLLLAAGWEGGEGLKVLCGGEALPRDLADRLLECGGELWNLYGPTETTIWSTVHALTPAAGPVSIGRPVANTEVHLLSPELEPVPLGVPGELMIAGRGLARGYLRRPALTAEKFIPNPQAARPGERLYRTGDLGRYLPGGLLDCLGRIDNQVKVRGFRIELGEIEAALGGHPELSEVVVSARQGDEPAGDTLLVAYFVPRGDQAPASGDLRTFLRSSLPEYMIPSIFMTLAELPLTPNGKVDRRALPAPERERGTEAVRVPPRTPVEERIAGVWRDVLGIAEISVHDSFFDLGGHSLLATQVMSRLCRDLRVDIPLRTIFDTPTVAGLAEVVVQREVEAADRETLARLLAEIEGA